MVLAEFIGFSATGGEGIGLSLVYNHCDVAEVTAPITLCTQGPHGFIDFIRHFFQAIHLGTWRYRGMSLLTETRDRTPEFNFSHGSWPGFFPLAR